MHSLSETSRKQHNHRSRISWIARRAKILLHMLSICTKHVKSWTQLVTCSLTSYRSHFSCQIFLVSFLLLSVISFARFSASMLSSFIDVSLCSVDAAHMHSRDLFDQMSSLLWSRLMLLTYASHRLRSFSNSTSSLECAGHMQFLKFNPTSRIFSNPGSTFPTPPASCTPVGRNTVSEEISVKII